MIIFKWDGGAVAMDRREVKSVSWCDGKIRIRGTQGPYETLEREGDIQNYRDTVDAVTRSHKDTREVTVLPPTGSTVSWSEFWKASIEADGQETS